MTDPADHPSTDLAAALRRELAAAAVPHDDSRAEAMIDAATTSAPLGARSWQAPLAAAAAVVVIGGGAASFAAVHGGGGTPSGDGPGACSSASRSPSTASAPVPPSTSVAPSTSTPASTTASPTAGLDSGSRSYAPPAPPTTGSVTTPAVTPDPASAVIGSSVSLPAPGGTTTLAVPSDSDDPCVADTATPSSTEPPGSATPSTGYLVTPSTGAPGTTTGAPPSAGVGTPSTSEPSASSVTSSASVITRLSTYPGVTVTRAVPFGVEGEPSVVTSIGFGRTPGMSGSITVLRGARATTVSDTLGSESEGDIIDPQQPLVFTPQAPLRLTLTCTGTTVCTVQVTVIYQLPVTVTRH